MMPEITVLCFGTFDGLHTGHEYFLKKARSLGSRLIVSVALDEHVKQLKNKKTKFNQTQRHKAISDLSYVDDCRLSDQQLGSYEIIKITRPDILAIGHDQTNLLTSCREWLQINQSKIIIEQIDYSDKEKKLIKLI